MSQNSVYQRVIGELVGYREQKCLSSQEKSGGGLHGQLGGSQSQGTCFVRVAVMTDCMCPRGWTTVTSCLVTSVDVAAKVFFRHSGQLRSVDFKQMNLCEVTGIIQYDESSKSNNRGLPIEAIVSRQQRRNSA